MMCSFNDDMKMAEYAIEDDIFYRTWLPAWLTTRCEPLITQFLQLDVGQITCHANIIRQAIKHVALDVRSQTAYTLGDIVDVAGVRLYHRLLKPSDYHTQFRDHV